MKLLLAHEDGSVIVAWDIEEDFGDLSEPLPRLMMAAEITKWWGRHKVETHTQTETKED